MQSLIQLFVLNTLKINPIMQTHSNNDLIAKGLQLGSWDSLTTTLFEIIQDIGGPFQWVEGNGQNLPDQWLLSRITHPLPSPLAYKPKGVVRSRSGSLLKQTQWYTDFKQHDRHWE